MFKRFLYGIVFGAGFGIAFAVIWTAWYAWIFPALFWDKWSSSTTVSSGLNSSTSPATVSKPPPISKSAKYLGTTGTFAGEFKRGGTLAAGDGVIAGKISTPEGPVENLSLRLALNGSVMTQWAITDPNGIYRIPVPFGDYRIDGFDIDSKSANMVLSGKIGSPNNPYQTEPFIVTPEQEGPGLDLTFVDPIVITGPIGEIRSDQELEVTWEPYPGATSYSVQVYESKNKYTFSYKGALFPWRNRPRVTKPRLKLSQYGITLKPDRYYSVEIVAFGDSGETLSSTPRSGRRNDFWILN